MCKPILMKMPEEWTMHEISESIPPAYTYRIGRHLMEAIR